MSVGVEGFGLVGNQLQASPFEFSPKLHGNRLNALNALLGGGLTGVEHRQKRLGNPRTRLRRKLGVALVGLLAEVGELRRHPLQPVEMLITFSRHEFKGAEQFFDRDRLSAAGSIIAGCAVTDIRQNPVRGFNRHISQSFLLWVRGFPAGIRSAHADSSSSSMISASTTSSSAGALSAASVSRSA